MTQRSTAQAQDVVIRDETLANANTATRIGTALKQIADNTVFIEDAATTVTTTTKASGVVGTATTFAREDHKHDISTAAAVGLSGSSANAEGTATSLARSDHTHAIANATGSVAGLESATDKTLFDAMFANGIDINQQRKRMVFKEDWAEGTTVGSHAWVTTARNSGTIPNSAIPTNSDQNHIGVIVLQTNANAAGGVTLSTNNFAFVSGTAQKWSLEFLVKVPTLSTTGTQQFISRFGLGTGLTAADQTDGFYVEYDAATDTHWRGCTANASTRSKQNTTATVTAGQWDRLRWHTEDGITFRLEINGTDSGLTWSGASIPTTPLLFFIQHDKSVGTTDRDLQVDYVDFYVDWTTPRAA